MSALLPWFDAHGVAVQAFATIVLVFVTGAYVFLTRRLQKETAKNATAAQELVAESRLARIAALEPLLIPAEVRYNEGHPTLQPGQQDAVGQIADPEHFELDLKNVGAGVASAIRVGYTLGKAESWVEVGAPVDGGGGRVVEVPIVRYLSLPEMLAERLSPPELLPKLGMLPVVDFDLHIQYQNIFGREYAVRTRHQLKGPRGWKTVCRMLGSPEVTGHVLGKPRRKEPTDGDE